MKTLLATLLVAAGIVSAVATPSSAGVDARQFFDSADRTHYNVDAGKFFSEQDRNHHNIDAGQLYGDLAREGR
jgi:hypothetical protein